MDTQQHLPGSDPSTSLKDPVSLHTRPPFPMQAQPWPGLASKMEPRPDHGETSYVGRARLTGRKALITGGDSGIGRAVAIAFAREGADVALSYLEAEEPDAQEVAALIRDAGRRVICLPGDIRDEGFCQMLVGRAAQALGGLDLLVNNAGRQQSAESILDISTDAFDWTFKTNVYAMFWITKAAVACMPPGAGIINTASVNSYDPSAHLLDYAMTKAAIANFTKGLAKQLAKHASAPFLLLHRSRRWNATQHAWIGHERKRGKLVALNRLVLHGDRTPFAAIEGDVAWLGGVRYAITLDVDTQLPRGAASELVATMAHPLIQPLGETGAKRAGYAILQPRVGHSMPVNGPSPYARLFGGEGNP